MKKYGMLIIVIMLMAVSQPAKAEVRAGSFSVTPFAGGYFFEGNQNSKDAFAAGLRAGYNFTKNLGVEGFYTYVPSKYEDTDAKNNVYIGGIEGLYHFFPEGSFVPFVAIGIGGYHFSDDANKYVPRRLAVDYGAGLKIFITDDIALRADVRHVLPLNDRFNDLLVSLGVTFSFGGKKKEVAAQAEEPSAPVVAARTEEPAPPVPAKVEETSAPAVKEPVPPVEAPAAVAPVAPVVEPAAPVMSQQSETKIIPEDDVKNFVNKWLTSWQAGDMDTYRSCYSSEFQSKGMNLDAWISFKNNVRQKSKDISIRIDDLKISVDGKMASATAIFNQYYSSSILKDSVRKTLNLKKINEQWKISKETIAPLK
ncbi:MAG: hypothetical protein CVU55_08785 [Deltaproteobacteria bacterium HGW-Deltaproteobacteria-13]|jgi:outer membrane beta-barrel protein|nr:MAG: hypothetical protein CVU55_08785 [Deltaproteobacteria bacterium HGW-Deltaproteobacteria-13]